MCKFVAHLPDFDKCVVHLILVLELEPLTELVLECLQNCPVGSGAFDGAQKHDIVSED